MTNDRFIKLLMILLIFISISLFQEYRVYKFKEEGLLKSVIIDSLDSELQNSLNINTRYEITLEYLKEIDSSAAKSFEHFLNNYTE
jgi:hypothetical protein